MSMKFGIVSTLAAAGLLAACTVNDPDSEPMATDSRIEFVANLDGRQETPPVATVANGSGAIMVDRATRRLYWDVTYNNLSSPVTGAHFHGPSGPGVAADVQVPVDVPTGATERIRGEAELTDEQMRDVLAGLWYLNIHTERYPDGEIRGQVENAGM
jgi:CHRD domain